MRNLKNTKRLGSKEHEEVEEVNSFRRSLGVRELTLSVRVCARCMCSFETYHHHRFCNNRCRSEFLTQAENNAM